jgi:hypothetical protein
VIVEYECSIKIRMDVALHAKLTHEIGSHNVGFLPQALARANNMLDDEIAYFQHVPTNNTSLSCL